MTSRRARRKKPKQPLSVYRREALSPGAHLLLAVIVVSLAVFTASFAVALVLLVAGEVALFAVVPRLDEFRSYIDDRNERAISARAANVRLELLKQMSDRHRAELERLGRLAAQIREKMLCENVDLEPVEAWLGIDRLLYAYARLAIAHNASAAFCAATRDELALHAARLESHAVGVESHRTNRRERMV